MKRIATSAIALLILATTAFAGENLKLNSKLDYTSDSQDGPLITGDSMDAGFVPGKPAYVILYGEGCFNSKRQARRTVGLYEKYKDRVQFVVIDLDQQTVSSAGGTQEEIFPWLHPPCRRARRGRVSSLQPSGEVDDAVISGLLDKTLR